MSDVGPESMPRNPSMVTVPEVTEPQRFTYKEFKDMDMSLVNPGAIIEGISPAKLFASQSWVDPHKLVTASEAELGESLDVPVWIGEIPIKDKPGEFQRVIALGDMHHRTLKAWQMGMKVNGIVMGRLPKGQRVLPLSTFRAKTGDPFAGMPE
jgi:hypothetical protein